MGESDTSSRSSTWAGSECRKRRGSWWETDVPQVLIARTSENRCTIEVDRCGGGSEQGSATGITKLANGEKWFGLKFRDEHGMASFFREEIGSQGALVGGSHSAIRGLNVTRNSERTNVGDRRIVDGDEVVTGTGVADEGAGVGGRGTTRCRQSVF